MSSRRERIYRNIDRDKKINVFKVNIVILLILLIIAIVYFTFFRNKENNNVEKPEITETEISVKEAKPKTVDEVVSEFGGEITEKVKEDTCYITKDGKEYTAYSDGEIVEGKIIPWTGEATEPPVDEAGNYNIYKPEELKWIANQIISGEKNFGGVTITLRNNLDFGAREDENHKWDGPKWESMIGFLDELKKDENQEEPKAEEQNNDNSNENVEASQPAEVTDPNIEITEENLKRFAGIFNGNDYWIRGIYIESEKRYQGLFGFQTGTIQNLNLRNCRIDGGEGTGAIAGLNGGTIVNCHTTKVEVSGFGSSKNKIGGISGINMTGSWIENCSTSDGLIGGNDYIGGITGYMNNNSAIISSTCSSAIGGNNYVGGIAGITFYGTQIKNCSNSSMNINGEKYVGGLVRIFCIRYRKFIS